MSLTNRLKSENDEKVVVHDKKDSFYGLKNDVQNLIIEKLSIIENADKLDSKTLEKEILIIMNQYFEEKNIEVSTNTKTKILYQMIDEILGLGPITSLINDKSVSEVMVNGFDHVYVEKEGKLELTEIKFKDNLHVLHIIEKIVAPLGRRIDESSPMVDARLPNGSRVNAIIPPLALNGPTITIRKFSEEPFVISDLIGFGTLTTPMAEFLKVCVREKMNIIVSGGTGSGKTTMLNVISSFIPNDERIVTIEDAAELQLHQEHIVRLETRPANIEGKGEVNIRDLVRNSLRMRPDRIIVGEVRSGEALDMLQAMNTGHDGSLTTGHANTPRDMLSRLETMVLMSGMDLPIKAIREQIASAINVIIQQTRLKDGTRRITHISEVQGMEGDVVILQDIFKFVQTGVDNRGKIIGKFEYSGIKPKITSIIGDDWAKGLDATASQQD
ncbi:MAG TPA: type II secretion system protein E [Clostridiales bacterium]|nr:MAG: type II secretion system protein E [Clostridiales bacterium GWD2_32_19]HCC06935.1 type II secretion system protein E [Clostridiales bacterium]